jgi:hypothetical protein
VQKKEWKEFEKLDAQAKANRSRIQSVIMR